MNISFNHLEGAPLKRNCTRGGGRGLPSAPSWYRKLGPVPGLSQMLNGRDALSFVGEAMCGCCWKTISDESSEFPRQGKPTLCRSCVRDRNVPLSPWQQPMQKHPKRPELLCGKLWSKLGGSRSWVCVCGAGEGCLINYLLV